MSVLPLTSIAWGLLGRGQIGFFEGRTRRMRGFVQAAGVSCVVLSFEERREPL